VGLVESLLNDVTAPLFALVIGVTVAVTAAPPGTATAQRRRYQNQTAIRAGALIAIGLLLDVRFSGVAVVLPHLGVTMLGPNAPPAIRAALDWIVLGRSHQALTLLPWRSSASSSDAPSCVDAAR
jgi:hypothetical protein